MDNKERERTHKETRLDSAIQATKQEKLFETNDIDELMDSLMK